MKIKYLIAVICITLIIAMPFSSINVYAQDEEKLDERSVGEAIVVNVKDYEPKVVTAGVLEEDDVPVYAFLEGYTLGEFLGVKEPQIEPFYGTPVIRSVKITEKKSSKDYRIIYKRPRSYSLDDLGYVVVMLKKVEKEHEVPDEYVLNLTAKIEFYFARGWGIGEQDLVLPEDPDEKKWKEEILTDYAFWSGDGYIRVADIEGNKANIVIYDSSLRRIGRSTLSIGETSGAITLRKVYAAMEDQFRVKLQDIVDPGAKRAYLRIRIDGDVKLRSLVEGRNLYAGSEWNVEIIRRKVRGEKIIEEVIIKNREGDETEITRTSSYHEVYNETSGSEIKIGKEDNIESVVEKLRKGFGNKVKFDYSATVFKDHKFNESTFSNDTTLAEILETLRVKDGLTHWYDKDKNKITLGLFREFEKETVADPCDDVKKPTNDNEEDWEKYYYCKAIKEFKEVIDEYPDVKDKDGILWKEKAYYWIGRAYEELYGLFEEVVEKDAARRRALQAYKQVKSFNIKDGNDRINKLEEEIVEEIYPEFVTIEDAGRRVELQLEGVVLEKDERATAFIEINYRDAKEYKEGEVLYEYSGEREDNVGSYNVLRIREILQDKVIVEKVYKNTDKRGLEELKLKKTFTIDGVDFRLVETDLKKRAIVTVLPGADERVYSESDFNLHIPIEKRPIDLTPETIDKEINKTEKTIEDLEKIINDLNKLVITLKKICLATFALITIKNFFAGGSRAIARRMVMNEKEVEVEGEKYTGWKDYCIKNSGRGEEYKYADYDVCMRDKADEINKDIEKVQGFIEDTNKVMKEIKLDTEEGRKKFAENILKNDLSSDELKVLSEYEALDPTNARDLTYLKLSSEDVDSYNKKIKEYKNLAGNYTKINEILEKHKEEKGTSEYAKLRDSLINQMIVSPAEDLTPEKIFEYDEKKEIFLALREEVEGGVNISTRYDKYKAKDEDMKSGEWLKIEEKERGQYIYYVFDPGTDTKIPVKKHEVEIKEKEKTIPKEVATKEYEIFEPYDFEKSKVLYAIKTVTRNRDYKDVKLHVDREGRPYIIPLKGTGGSKYADYVEILGYTNSGNPTGTRIWNVGPDGEIATKDDIRISEEELGDIANRAFERVKGQYEKGASIRLFGNTYIVDTALAIEKEKFYGPQCQDVMEIGDCTLLYAVCDPVMCPVSRCDLDGRWPVNNVIQTGILGSIALCAPRFLRVPTIPACLTGILASLQNIKTILQGYVECLKTARVHDMSVGICDKIRSVFICELVWRELIAIFNIYGGIMNWISKSVFGEREGGGEYLTFKESMQNVADSVKFFTQEYAQTAFAAYRARSAEEIGTDICRAAVFRKAPWVGEFIDQISKPESPPQFTAVFSEMPWSEAMEESRYNVYYHIYAGEDQEVGYSVFLRNKYDSKMGIVYVTEKCGGRRGRIEQGGFADYSVDCIAKSGFNEVCVEINGVTSCGFGRVSSAFALGYLNDLIVEGELKKKIDSEVECMPDSSTFSPGFSALIDPEIVGMESMKLRTGLIRVCSVLNPGEGTNPGDWKIIGDCGKDEKGRFLGYCWLDMRTISINDAERYENVVEALEKTGLGYEKERRGLDVLDKEDSEAKFNQIEKELEIKFGDDWEITEIKGEYDSEKGYLRLIEEYEEELIEYSVDEDTLAKTQFIIGMIYFKLAEDFSKLKETEEKKEEEKEIIEEIIPAKGNKPTITVEGVPEMTNKKVIKPVILIGDEEDKPGELTVTMTLNEDPYEGEEIKQEGNYLLKITVKDTDGNEVEKEVRFIIDWYAPDIVLIIPDEVEIKNGVMRIEARVGDYVYAPVLRVRFIVDGYIVGSDNTKPYTHDWDVTGYVDGEPHTLEVKVYDGVGNIGTSEEKFTFVEGDTEEEIRRIPSA